MKNREKYYDQPKHVATREEEASGNVWNAYEMLLEMLWEAKNAGAVKVYWRDVQRSPGDVPRLEEASARRAHCAAVRWQRREF